MRWKTLSRIQFHGHRCINAIHFQRERENILRTVVTLNLMTRSTKRYTIAAMRFHAWDPKSKAARPPILQRWQPRPRIKRNAARVFTSATTVDTRISRLPKRSNRFQSLNPRGVVALLRRASTMLIFCRIGRGGENIRNILALNRRSRGNKTRNIFAFRDIETFPPFYPSLFSNRSNNKRQRALRTSRRGSLPFKKIFQQSGEEWGWDSWNEGGCKSLIFYIREWWASFRELKWNYCFFFSPLVENQVRKRDKVRREIYRIWRWQRGIV